LLGGVGGEELGGLGDQNATGQVWYRLTDAADENPPVGFKAKP